MFDPRGPTLLELAHQALSSTTKGYDLLAPKFEHTPFRTPDPLLRPLSEAAGEDGEIASALDIACGTGAVMRALRPHCTDHVTGIDLSSGMLDEAARQLEKDGGSAEIRLLRMDALQMNFDAEFDVAASAGAFGHILHDQQDAFARRVHRALRPGGRFLFVTHPMPSPRQSEWWLARGFNAAMHLRNALRDPPFIMFYLTFTTERARQVLERNGFDVEERTPYTDTQWPQMRLMIATRRG